MPESPHSAEPSAAADGGRDVGFSEFIGSEAAAIEWRADEMWRLESLWSPVGSLAYVPFLVDLISDGDRKKGEGVWAVMASSIRPASRLKVEGEFTLRLGRGWDQELLAFFKHWLLCAVKTKTLIAREPPPNKRLPADGTIAEAAPDSPADIGYQYQVGNLSTQQQIQHQIRISLIVLL